MESLKNETDARKNEFTIYNKIRDFNKYVRDYIVNNIPSNYRDVRIHLLDECYALYGGLFGAVYNKGSIKLKYLNEMKRTLSLIDVLISDIKDMKVIKTKNLTIAVSKLASIKNMIYGWVKNEEKEKK